MYITSRAGTHAIHKAYANSIHADFQYVDHHIPWHGVKASRLKRYISWLICPFLFPEKKKYALFINSGPQFPQVFMRKWGLLARSQKIAVLLDNETLYFLQEQKFPATTQIGTRWALAQYDIYICVSKYMTNLLHEQIEVGQRPVVTLFNGVEDQRLQLLLSSKPNLTTHTIGFIGNIYAGWRREYKGFDLLLSSFKLAQLKIPNLKLICIGEVDPVIAEEIKEKESIKNIEFVGRSSNLLEHLNQVSLYMQPSQGESWGIATLEAMAAGIPTLVTNKIGVMEVVSRVDESFVVPPMPVKLADRIVKYFHSELKERDLLSEKFRKIAMHYSQSNAVAHFKEEIENLKL